LKRIKPKKPKLKGSERNTSIKLKEAETNNHHFVTLRKNADFFIFITVLVLLFIGTIMVASSTAAYAGERFGDSFYFIKRQMVYVILGVMAMFAMMNVNYKRLGKISPILMMLSIFLLIIVLIPGIGVELNEARRWIGIRGQTIQPTEVAKLSIILFLSYSLSKKKDKVRNFTKGLLPYLGLLGIIAGLVMLEPHFSATVIIGSVTMILLFAAGAKLGHFVLLSAPVMSLGTFLVISSPYRLRRLVAFLDPWSDVRGGGWQIIQSLLAIGSGGLFGRGTGKSLQKLLYIPEPYNDFIFSILAEEFGFLGVILVAFLFGLLIWRGFKVAMNAPDTFGGLVALGITSLIAIQVIINIAVVTSSMPVTGMPLPFFSYGGTSLIFLLSGVGILLNISRYAKYDRI
jgi:cell division protein FtsW